VVSGFRSSIWCVGGEGEVGREASLWWKEISWLQDGSGEGEGMGWFAEVVEQRVCEGVDMIFWSDPWLGEVPLSVWFSRLFFGGGGGR
jgi:hypothetical protein